MKNYCMDFQTTNKGNLAQEDLGMANKGVKLKREIEFLLIAARNNAIRTNYVNAKKDQTQQNSRHRLL